MKLVIDGQTVEVPGGGGSNFPSGGIIIWSGAADNIPSGWALCNGQNGTPDLRDKFVLGAGTSHAIGSKGGEETVTLTIEQMPSHNHGQMIMMDEATGIGLGYQVKLSTVSSGGVEGYVAPRATKHVTNSSDYIRTQNRGTFSPHNNMPPYYALCYIMKL